MTKNIHLTPGQIQQELRKADQAGNLPGFRYPEKPVVVRTDLPGPFALDLPEIYQIEVSNACNFSCTVCPRTLYKRKDKRTFFDEDLLAEMADRGDFSCSYFVELQMSGEPLLHPKIQKIIKILKSTGVLVGLSTNGEFLPEKVQELKGLDYITVSIDSVTDRPKVRKGASSFPDFYMDDLEEAILTLININHGISVDFQFIELPGFEKEIEAFKTVVDPNILSYSTVRTVPDCFITKFIPSEHPNDKGMCLNPFLSVSIQSNGNVVPCCFAWGDDIIYGSLRNQSLKEIWEGEQVQILRDNHKKGMIPELCFQCYMRSPAMLHWQIYFNSIRRNKA